MSLKPNADKAKSPKGATSSGPVSLPSERKGSWVKVKGGPVVAVVDMGTNSFHMIVCQASPEKDHFEVLAKVKEAVPFFRRSLSAHYIDEQALRSALRILRDMLKNAREHGASYTMAVATSAVRESKNGEECLRRIRAELKMDARAIEKLLYQQSGLLGVSGVSSDMRTLLASDEPRAKFAVELFVYRIGRELGSLAAALGGLDALVFTAGIGEHAAPIRERVCHAAAWLGVELDPAANAAGGPRLSTAGSWVPVWVIPTNEELMIARHTRVLVAAGAAG